jgi:hypothetical protein
MSLTAQRRWIVVGGVGDSVNAAAHERQMP